SAGNFSAAPQITALSPAGGAPGIAVVISGIQLTGATGVKFNGTPASFTLTSSTQIRATVPANAISGPVTVTTPAGTVSRPMAFSVAPRITAWTPSGAPVGGTVVISGANFSGATAVTFNGVSAGLSVDSASRITATVPSGATSGRITVATPAGATTSAA